MDTIPCKIDNFFLAPSKVTMRDACEIAKYIFRPSRFAETGDVINLLSRTPYHVIPYDLCMYMYMNVYKSLFAIS